MSADRCNTSESPVSMDLSSILPRSICSLSDKPLVLYNCSFSVSSVLIKVGNNSIFLSPINKSTEPPTFDIELTSMLSFCDIFFKICFGRVLFVFPILSNCITVISYPANSLMLYFLDIIS